MENASTRYRNGDFSAKVKEKTNLGWMFTFLGAGIDAIAQADQFGIDAGHTLRYGRSRSRDAFRLMESAAARFAPDEEEDDGRRQLAPCICLRARKGLRPHPLSNTESGSRCVACQRRRVVPA